MKLTVRSRSKTPRRSSAARSSWVLTFFDTADAYGAGRMEKLLGKIIVVRATT